MKKAFTLIELLVVVLIVGILTAVALPQYQKAVDKARFVQVMLVGDKISQAQQVYYWANGKFADTAAELGADVPGGYTAQPWGGNDGVLVWDDFYCHTGNTGWVYCWLRKPGVGFLTNTVINSAEKSRQCILCRSSNSANLKRAENMCIAISGKALPEEGNCVSVDLP